MIPKTSVPLQRLFKRLGLRSYRYRQTFSSGNGREVLKDLAVFCHAESPCENERDTGRRDVWLRIRRHLDLSQEELTILYARLTPEARYQLHNPGSTYTDDEE